MEPSIFTKIITGDIPSQKIFENEHSFAFLDIAPVNPGHTLVIPKEQFVNIEDIPSEIFLEVMKTVHFLASKIKAAVEAEGINIIMNNGAIAGQIVMHAHVHIVPRFPNDGFHHWKGDPKHMETIGEVAEKIRSSL